MKIVATVKPGRDAPARIDALRDLGVTCFRVNFARRPTDENGALVARLAELRRNGDIDAVFADLPGRKARLWPIPDGRRHLHVGERYALVPGPVDAPGVLGLLRPWFLGDVGLGDRITIGSSVVEVEVGAMARSEGIAVRVIRPGEVYNRCTVQVDAARYRPSVRLVEEDRAALRAGAWAADFVCLSFADAPAILDEAAQARVTAAATARIVAKVESPAAVTACAELAERADGLLLGRGDLASFFEPPELDALAGTMAAVARRQGRTVIMATDYLPSLAAGSQGPPTGPEAMRIQRARHQGADFLVLNETATSDNWHHVARMAVRFQRDRVLAPGRGRSSDG